LTNILLITADDMDGVRADRRGHIGVINDLLRQEGYLTGILGKVTYLQPVERIEWDVAVDGRHARTRNGPQPWMR
jgi:hypothetical protein